MNSESYLLGRVPHRSAQAVLRSHLGLWPRLHPSVFLADGATVTGDVEMGEGCSVWFHAIVRGDVHSIRMGARCNIQDGAIIHCTYRKHPTTLGDEVSVGHMAMVHGCTIGSGTLIGMQAVVMDGAVVGEDCIIGAGAIITEGKIIPPRSLVVGSPGKVIREVSPEQTTAIRATALRYMEYAKGYNFMEITP